MKHYKKISALLLAAVLAFAMIGCGSSAAPEDTAAEQFGAETEETGTEEDEESPEAAEPETTTDDEPAEAAEPEAADNEPAETTEPETADETAPQRFWQMTDIITMSSNLWTANLSSGTWRARKARAAGAKVPVTISKSVRFTA